MLETFTITEDHLKLLRRMYVSWQDCEYGAPEINPKRPYGNSSVEEDIAEILGWELLGTDDGEPCLSEGQREKACALHIQMEKVLQIVLIQCPDSVVGQYRKTDEYDSMSWTL